MSASDDEIDLTLHAGQAKRAEPVDPDSASEHSWGAPPPGAGGRNQRTCRVCGQRLTVVGAGSPCPGRHSSAVAETINDYDPFA